MLIKSYVFKDYKVGWEKLHNLVELKSKDYASVGKLTAIGHISGKMLNSLKLY